MSSVVWSKSGRTILVIPPTSPSKSILVNKKMTLTPEGTSLVVNSADKIYTGTATLIGSIIKYTCPFYLYFTGNYTCLVEWSGNPISITHYLEVLEPPTVYPVGVDPEGAVRAREGDDVTLECDGQGTPKPTIRWVRRE